MFKFPGLIDIHVHFRDPGATHKEDFETGTKAALAGGFTTVLDMPNNSIPITTPGLLKEKQDIARTKIVCDTGFFYGSLGENIQSFTIVQDMVFGLKIYLNQTTGGFIVDDKVFTKICKVWPRGKPILVHAEEDVIEQVLQIGHQAGQRIHVCHISSRKELETIIKAKAAGWNVTCGVTPHHLFLTVEDANRLGPFGRMKPFLKTKTNQAYLWENLSQIDLVESDHAPHTKEEKESDNPPFGVPGLETTLGLMLTAVHQGKVRLDEVKRLLFDNPKKIFNIPTDESTFIEVDESEKWVVENGNLFTKCNWSPFNGMALQGKVKSVTLRGEKVFENGQILAKPGSGTILSPKI